jgi:hypothetical protein
MVVTLQEKPAGKTEAEAQKTRGRVWYGHYKQLAEALEGQNTAQVLRIFHQFLDGHYKYGTDLLAESAQNSMEQVIKDLQLDKPSLTARLRQIVAEAYGKTISVTELLAALTNMEIEEVFSDLYQGLQQEGRLE